MNKLQKHPFSLLCTAILTAVCILSLLPAAPVRAADDIAMYRMFNTDTAEHLYTNSETERDVLIQKGWVYEGIGFYTVSAGPGIVHRLYNPASTDHHYTQDENEYHVLVSSGAWNDEGIAWYSADPAAGVPMYRLFAPSLVTGAHHYTTSVYERDQLIASGAWEYEGIAWYVAGEGEPIAQPAPPMVTGIYRGVDQYGSASIRDAASFRYIFEVAGSPMAFSIDASDPSFPIQNTLIHGYTYHLTVDHGRITASERMPRGGATLMPVFGTPGVYTIKNLLQTAMLPVGNTLYVYGGGWNWQDTGACTEPDPLEWMRFFHAHAADYDYDTGANRDSFFPHGEWNEYYYAGLDCSGYMGFTVSSLLTVDGMSDDYTVKAASFAQNLANHGFGTKSRSMAGARPGDIVSAGNHVWMVVGVCGDGSIVLLDSTPSPGKNGRRGGGPALRALGANASCEANQLAQYYMKNVYGGWYNYFENTMVNPGAYTTFSLADNGRFSWDLSGSSVLTDPDGYLGMSAAQILEDMFLMYYNR